MATTVPVDAKNDKITESVYICYFVHNYYTGAEIQIVLKTFFVVFLVIFVLLWYMLKQLFRKAYEPYIILSLSF
jgi:hypothetical protein